MAIMLQYKMFDLLRAHLTEPTSRGLAIAISRAVSDGSLQQGQRLAPIRTVARELGLSPSTVSAAWSLLIRSGTIHTDGRRGTVIARLREPGPRRYRLALNRTGEPRLDLSTGVPDPALLPDLRPALRRLPGAVSPGSYLDDPVLPELQDVLRADWPFGPERLTVLDGAMDALDLLTASLVQFGDRVAVEHPCFPPLLDLLESVGAEVVAVDQDDDGPLPQSLTAALDQGVVAVYLQPRAQNPTGAALRPERAQLLAEALADSPAVVIENDSAGAVAGADLISLDRWRPGRVVHIRSFSKSHGPDLRLAAVGGPASVLDPVIERRLLGQGWTSRVLQHLLLDLLTSPETIDQVGAARAVYAERRVLTTEALLAQGVPVSGRDGMNVWVPVADETAALLHLAAAGISASAGSPFAAKEGMAPHLRVTTALLREGYADFAAELAQAARLGGWTGPR